MPSQIIHKTMAHKLLYSSSSYNTILLALAIVAVFVSILSAGITYNYLTAFRSRLTGFATETGTINISIEALVSINFTNDTINFGSGRISQGFSYAVLNTSTTGAAATNVSNGNWSGNTQGFYLENIGNKNVTMNISFGTNAAGLIGGTSPVYQYNLTNFEPNSCTNLTGQGGGNVSLGVFRDANTTAVLACDRFPFDNAGKVNDSVRVDLTLTIPSDSKTGALNDTITVTFSEQTG